MDNVDDSVNVIHRGKDYEKFFVNGVAWLLYLNPDFDSLPDFIKDIVLSHISESDS